VSNVIGKRRQASAKTARRASRVQHGEKHTDTHRHTQTHTHRHNQVSGTVSWQTSGWPKKLVWGGVLHFFSGKHEGSRGSRLTGTTGPPPQGAAKLWGSWFSVWHPTTISPPPNERGQQDPTQQHSFSRSLPKKIAPNERLGHPDPRPKFDR